MRAVRVIRARGVAGRHMGGSLRMARHVSLPETQSSSPSLRLSCLLVVIHSTAPMLHAVGLASLGGTNVHVGQVYCVREVIMQAATPVCAPR